MTAWDVRYARKFNDLLMELPEHLYDRIELSIDVLASNPGLARPYDPDYEAAQPPAPCLWYHVPKTSKDLYLIADETEHLLIFIFMTDAREDPRGRFDSMDEWDS